MPKVKTHHWAGVTLGLKNIFGTIPGRVYGWPKNVLHWKGIDRSILDNNSTMPPHFVIAEASSRWEASDRCKVTRGIQAILWMIEDKAPDATIILTAIFPRNDNMAFRAGDCPDQSQPVAGRRRQPCSLLGYR